MHTPGPCFYHEVVGHREIIRDGVPIARLTDDALPGDGPMFAAAHELLEAAKEGRDFISTLLGNNTTEATDLLTNHGEDVEDRLRAAISKAVGFCACGSDGGEDITTCADCGKPLPKAEGRETT